MVFEDEAGSDREGADRGEVRATGAARARSALKTIAGDLRRPGDVNADAVIAFINKSGPVFIDPMPLVRPTGHVASQRLLRPGLLPLVTDQIRERVVDKDGGQLLMPRQMRLTPVISEPITQVNHVLMQVKPLLHPAIRERFPTGPMRRDADGVERRFSDLARKKLRWLSPVIAALHRVPDPVFLDPLRSIRLPVKGLLDEATAIVVIEHIALVFAEGKVKQRRSGVQIHAQAQDSVLDELRIRGFRRGGGAGVAGYPGEKEETGGEEEVTGHDGEKRRGREPDSGRERPLDRGVRFSKVADSEDSTSIFRLYPSTVLHALNERLLRAPFPVEAA